MRMTFEDIHKPSHYVEGRKYEPRRVAEDWGLVNDAYLFTAFKYIARAGRKPVDGSMLKGKIQDIEKAREYLGYRLELLHEQMLAEQCASEGQEACVPMDPGLVLPTENNTVSSPRHTEGDEPMTYVASSTDTRLRDVS